MTAMHNSKARLKQWTPAFVISTIGLSVLSLAILITGSYWENVGYRVAAFVGSLLGLVLAAGGFTQWARARVLRRALLARRANGATVWPIRARSRDGGWEALGLLEAGKTGVAVSVESREASVEWSDVNSVSIADGGLLRGKFVILDAGRSGRLELEPLQDNVVARMGDRDAQSVAATLMTLKDQSVSAAGTDIEG